MSCVLCVSGTVFRMSLVMVVRLLCNVSLVMVVRLLCNVSLVMVVRCAATAQRTTITRLILNAVPLTHSTHDTLPQHQS